MVKLGLNMTSIFSTIGYTFLMVFAYFFSCGIYVIQPILGIYFDKGMIIWGLDDWPKDSTKKHQPLYIIYNQPMIGWCVFHVAFEWRMYFAFPFLTNYQLSASTSWKNTPFHRPGADHGVPGEVVHSPRSARPNVSADHWRQHASHVTQLRVAYLPGVPRKCRGI